MNVYWLEQSEADVPQGDDWLSAAEKDHLSGLRVPKRRSDWLLGRWTAKLALSVYLNTPAQAPVMAKIEIRPAASGAPEIFIADRRAPAAISLSHCKGNALCTIAPVGTALGCDLELAEPRSDAFVADYFTAAEQALVARASAADRPGVVTLLWSAKESALKALHKGLRLDTRSAIVSLPKGVELPKPEGKTCATNSEGALPQQRSTWQPLEVHCAGGEVFPGWWRQAGSLLRTLVASPTPNSPIALRLDTAWLRQESHQGTCFS
jgi:4'-phosphopantetheinyl transferase